MTGHSLSVTGHSLSVTGHSLSVTDHSLSVTGHSFMTPVTGSSIHTIIFYNIDKKNNDIIMYFKQLIKNLYMQPYLDKVWRAKTGIVIPITWNIKNLSSSSCSELALLAFSRSNNFLLYFLSLLHINIVMWLCLNTFVVYMSG